MNHRFHGLHGFFVVAQNVSGALHPQGCVAPRVYLETRTAISCPLGTHFSSAMQFYQQDFEQLPIITHRCTKCNSTNITKNGTDYKGDQKFHCLACDAYGTLEPRGRSYPEFFKELVMRAYRERSCMRGIERIFGIVRQTLARWILEKAGGLPDLVDTLEIAQANDVLELDELWSFVLKKSAKRWI